ncbi:MAG: DUF1648 domain-containing protein, partial [Streptosporangiaceae bacterium]
ALMCAAPAVTRPTLQFGVRVPAAHTGAAVIRRERRAYYWRSAAVAVCCAAAAIIFWGSGSRWLPRAILLLEITADAGCVWLARRKIIGVKTAESWFAGLRQTVVADTSWRTQRQPFPVRWLIPAISVIAATAAIGFARYPHLPAQLATGLATLGSRRVPRSPVSAFATVIAQLYVTGLWTGLTVLIYRSRPDIDAADPAASLRRYRGLLASFTRAALALPALIDLTLLLIALQQWQLYRLHGTSAFLPLLPAVAGVLILIAVAMRAGRDRVRPVAIGQRSGQAMAAGRDDDRFWKAGLFYVNRTDPAIMVTTRIGVGWTLNLGNPAAWLVIAVIIATVAGLGVLRIAAGT